jgi:hypothetical protein
MYASAGFRVVPLAPTDILTSLQTNMIEAFPAPATAALANQWFGLAKNMMDIKFAPVVGATIITKGWEKVDLARPVLLKLARAGEIHPDPRLETDAINAMVKAAPDPETDAAGGQEWQQTAEKFCRDPRHARSGRPVR